MALEELAKTVRWLTLPGGETLFRGGDPGESIYLVASGRLRVSDGALEREAARGDCVGELALLTGERRSATVVAVRDTELAELTRADFDRVAERYPAAILDLARLVAARLLGAGDNRDVPPVSTIALVPMPSVNLNEIAIVIRDALSTIGSTLHVSAARELVADEQARTRWLNAQEFEHTFVLYEADEGLTSWTRCCIRQADRVLMFARPDSPRAIPGIPASSELVLIHRAAPVGTDRWPADAFACRHHVLEDSREDLERVVRHVTGHAVGLVLSGGGARAFAQIGVVRALGEAGVPIDRVGGTSIGAVLGAQIAARNDWRRLVELHRGRWRNDYTLPHLALLAGKRTRKGVEAWFGDTRIEDLWLPFFCVSTNLSSAEMVVHRQGVVRDAVRASMSVPGGASTIRSRGWGTPRGWRPPQQSPNELHARARARNHHRGRRVTTARLEADRRARASPSTRRRLEFAASVGEKIGEHLADPPTRDACPEHRARHAGPRRVRFLSSPARPGRRSSRLELARARRRDRLSLRIRADS